MKYYIVVQFKMLSKDWLPDYIQTATKLIENAGGKYLSRTNNFEVLEGSIEKNSFVVLTEWTSKKSAELFYNSDEYKPYREARLSGTEGNLLLIPGEDITNASSL